MDNRIYCFYPATYGVDTDGNALLYNIYNGSMWTGEAQVPSTNTSGTPSAIDHDEKIWCFHQGNLNNGELWYNVLKGTDWQGDVQIPASALSAGPSACVYDGEIFCFYPGSYDQYSDGNALLYNIFDGDSWTGEVQVPETNISQAPSATVYRGAIYCFHQGNLNNGQLWYNVYDGEDWLGDVSLPASPLSSGPSSCVYQDKLYCFYPGSFGQDSDGNALLYNVFDGESWAGEQQVPATNIANNPSAVVFEGMIYIFHEGNLANGQLWYNRFDGTEWLGDTQIPAAPLSFGPGATNNRRTFVRELLDAGEVRASPDLPPLDTITFTVPPGEPMDEEAVPDDIFNWTNRENPPDGWGMTGVVCFRTCTTSLGELAAGSMVIYPGIRMSKDEADHFKKYYNGLIQFNGKQGGEPLYQDRGNPLTSLHGRLITKLMPPGYAGDFNTFKQDFLGFAFDGTRFKFKKISNLLNSQWFYHVHLGRQMPSERMSNDWGNKLLAACQTYFPGVKGKPEK